MSPRLPINNSADHSFGDSKSFGKIFPIPFGLRRVWFSFGKVISNKPNIIIGYFRPMMIDSLSPPVMVFTGRDKFVVPSVFPVLGSSSVFKIRDVVIMFVSIFMVNNNSMHLRANESPSHSPMYCKVFIFSIAYIHDALVSAFISTRRSFKDSIRVVRKNITFFANREFSFKTGDIVKFHTEPSINTYEGTLTQNQLT